MAITDCRFFAFGLNNPMDPIVAFRQLMGCTGGAQVVPSGARRYRLGYQIEGPRPIKSGPKLC
jgi:hypothetical protein